MRISTAPEDMVLLHTYNQMMAERVIKFTADERCTVTCDARLTDPRGRQLPPGHLKFVAEAGSDGEEFPIPVFTAAERGTYTVQLSVNGSSTPSASQTILVDVAASLA